MIHAPEALSIPGDTNWWKLVSMIALMPILLPIALAMRILRVGSGLLGGMFTFHAIAKIFERPDPIQVSDYIVESGTRRVQARQEGFSRDGRIVDGDEVRLEGRMRNGVFIISGGEDITTGARITLPGNPWRTMFLVGVGLFAALMLLGLLSAAVSPAGVH